MSAGAAALLARLGSGMRAIDAPPGVTRAHRADGCGTFAALLDKAKAGDVASGLPVAIDPALGLNLSEGDLSRLAEGADRATAAGAERALLTMDGRGYVLDVGTRTIVSSADLSERSTLVGIDAVIGVGVEEREMPAAAPGALLAWRSSSLVRALNRDDTAGA